MSGTVDNFDLNLILAYLLVKTISSDFLLQPAMIWGGQVQELEWNTY